MKLVHATVALAALAFALPAEAQQARSRPAAPQAVQQPAQQAPGAVAPIENKALARLKCYLGTANPKDCAKVGFDFQPLNSRT